MPFEQFDRSALKLKPLGERIHDLDQSVMQDIHHVRSTMDHPTIDLLADRIIAAMDKVIAAKTVTYDFARQMGGATEVKCSEFGNALAAAM